MPFFSMRDCRFLSRKFDFHLLDDGGSIGLGTGIELHLKLRAGRGSADVTTVDAVF